MSNESEIKQTTITANATPEENKQPYQERAEISPDVPVAVTTPQPNIVVIPSEPKQNVIAPPSPPPPPKRAMIEWNDSQYIKKIFQLVNVLVDEPTILINTVPETNLEIKAMDPSRVAMISLIMSKEGCTEFDETELAPSEQMKFALSLEHLIKRVLKNVNKDEDIRFEMMRSKDLGKVVIVLKGKLMRRFEVPMLEESAEQIPSPKLNLTHMSTLVLDGVNDLFKDLDDHVRIIGTADALSFTSHDDYGKFQADFHKGDETILNIEYTPIAEKNVIPPAEAKATYSVSYLKEMFKALAELTDIATIRFASDMPMEITANLGNKGTVKLYLAPRVESE